MQAAVKTEQQWLAKSVGKVSYVESAVYSPENIDINETWRKVLGMDITIPMSITMTEKTTVHCE
jgi:hypothetical protein